VVRATAAEALGKLHDFAATMPLLGLLSDESDLVRINSLRALAVSATRRRSLSLSRRWTRRNQACAVPHRRARGSARDDVLPRLHRMSRNWPVGREPKDVRETAQQAIAILEAALAQEALKIQPGEAEEGRQP